MDQNLERVIRERAYEIWASHGYVHGQADQHWRRQEPCAGQLRPHITPEMSAPVRRQSAR